MNVMSRRWQTLLGIPCILATAIINASIACADSVADFYTGHPITISVGFEPGGGYDIYARTLARHFGDHVPGHPTVVVKNEPGAAGLSLVNYIFNAAPKDGTEIATFNRTIILYPLLAAAGQRFDPKKLEWLGSPSTEVSTCVSWYTARVKSIEDLKTTELLVPGTGSASDATIYPALMRDVLGLKFKVVNGYQGSADSLLALQRGEVDGYCPWGWSSIQATHPDWLRDHKINVLLQTGLRKDPEHQDIPLALDLATTPKDRQALELMFSPDLFARPFVTSPGVPRDRVSALKKAFADTVHDPAFLQDAAKAKLDVDYVSGDDVLAELQRIYNTPADVVSKVQAVMGVQ
jgi:tripartite-type tricarboxylate transporter receptor subunit TctC